MTWTSNYIQFYYLSMPNCNRGLTNHPTFRDHQAAPRRYEMWKCFFDFGHNWCRWWLWCSAWHLPGRHYWIQWYCRRCTWKGISVKLKSPQNIKIYFNNLLMNISSSVSKFNCCRQPCYFDNVYYTQRMLKSKYSGRTVSRHDIDICRFNWSSLSTKKKSSYSWHFSL